MRRELYTRLLILSILLVVSSRVFAVDIATKDAKWITIPQFQEGENQWFNFVENITLKRVPNKAVARIAVDSKYWLWINGELVVLEGQLKRGPNREDTYVDFVDLAPWLKRGDNKIAILSCYFGKDGFSHNSSGKAGLFFECKEIGLNSNKSWRVQ